MSPCGTDDRFMSSVRPVPDRPLGADALVRGGPPGVRLFFESVQPPRQTTKCDGLSHSRPERVA
jgi:hypothetical protein